MAVNDASNADCILPDEFKYSVIIFKSDVSALNAGKRGQVSYLLLHEIGQYDT